MGVGDLPPTGVRLVAENAGGFAKDMDMAEGALKSFQNTLRTLSRISPSGAYGQPSWLDAFDKQAKVVSTSMRSLTKELTSAGKARIQLKNLIPPQMTEALQETAKTLDRFVWRLRFIPQPLREAVWGLRGFSEGMSGFIGNLRVGTVGLAAFGLAVLGLGLRGKAMTGIIEAFKVTSNMALTTSRVLLNDLQVAAKGTIRDLDLMRVANIGLAGAGQKLAAALGKGKGLAGLLEIARAQARATGQDVKWMYESLVTGIKRSSPRLIDNTGLVLKLQEAYDAYAAKIGKAADSLSEEEKQIALLNATLKAGELAVKTYGKGTLTANEYMQRIGATVANTLDKLAVAVQPLMVAILSVADVFVRVLAWPLQNVVAPILYELMNNAIYPLMNALKILASAFSSAFGPLGDIVHNTVVVIIAGFRTIGILLNWLLTSLAKVIGGILGLVKPMTKAIATLLDPRKLFIGAAYFIGAMADGMLWAFNNSVLPALIFIAQTIADFLCGMSPPKKGPLKDIDKGGAKVFEAWLEGFTGVSLLPIRTVLDEVNQWLGPIAQMSLDVINQKIQQLDLQIRPFQETLKIIKDEMDAILAPLNRIDEILHRKLEKGLVEFFGGRLGAEAVRAIDRQIEKFGDQKEAYQAMTDQAQLQLEYMTLEQVEQRSMLEIQKARLELMEKLPKEAKAKAPKEPTGKEEPAAAGAAAELGLPDVGGAIGEWMGYEDDVTKFMKDVSESFMKGFKGGKQLDIAKAKVGELKKQMDRIGNAPAMSKIKDAFNTLFGIPGDISNTFGKFTTYLGDEWDKAFGEGGTLRTAWDDFTTKVQSDTSLMDDPEGPYLGPINEMRRAIKEMKWEMSFDPLRDAIKNLGKDIRGYLHAPENFYSIRSSIDDLVGGIPDWLSTIPDVLKKWLTDKVGDATIEIRRSLVAPENFYSITSSLGEIISGIPKWLETLPGLLKEWLSDQFDLASKEVSRIIIDPGNFYSIPSTLGQIVSGIGSWLGSLPGQIKTWLTDKFSFETMNIHGILVDPENFYSIPSSLGDLVSAIPGALVDLAKSLVDYLWSPFKMVIGWISDEIDKLKKKIEEIKDSIAGMDWGITGGETPGITKQEWDQFAAREGVDAAIRMYGPRENAKAFGGNVMPGVDYIVGDKGWEIFRPQVPGKIIPHVLARGQMAPERTINQGGPVSNSWSNQRSTTITANFNLRDTAQNRRMRLAELRGWGI